MKKFDVLYSSMRENKLSAYNHITTKNLGVCFNIIEIPSTEGIDIDTSVITVSIMKHRKRKNAMELNKFAKFMGTIEETLKQFYVTSEHPYFRPLSQVLPNKWYYLLDCHRVFLIPTNHVTEVITELFARDCVGKMFATGLSEVSLVVSTNKHDSYAQFFN